MKEGELRKLIYETQGVFLKIKEYIYFIYLHPGGYFPLSLPGERQYIQLPNPASVIPVHVYHLRST